MPGIGWIDVSRPPRCDGGPALQESAGIVNRGLVSVVCGPGMK